MGMHGSLTGSIDIAEGFYLPNPSKGLWIHVNIGRRITIILVQIFSKVLIAVVQITTSSKGRSSSWHGIILFGQSDVVFPCTRIRYQQPICSSYVILGLEP
jgi:hypothetical protein